jgi:hypothetical protein
MVKCLTLYTNRIMISSQFTGKIVMMTMQVLCILDCFTSAAQKQHLFIWDLPFVHFHLTKYLLRVYLDTLAFHYLQCCLLFFSNTREAYHCIKKKRIGTVFGYNPNETDSRWTQTCKPAEHNLKQKL